VNLLDVHLQVFQQFIGFRLRDGLGGMQRAALSALNKPFILKRFN
jgi:hypothetical protein